MNMRRILKQPTLRMRAGGVYGDDKTAAFVAANPAPGTPAPAGAGRGNINPALVMPAAGAGRGNINPASVTPDAAPALSSPAQVTGGGNSFGDAASLRPGSAPTPFAQQSNLQQYASQDVAARGAGMAKTSGDWARTTPYMPPGVSPMPAAGAISAAAPTPSTAATQAKQGRSLALPAGFEPSFTPMAVPGLKTGGDLRTGMGGHVPGQGKGDKIDAKYEPGEFVVSNAMLASAPGLREQLHDLRGNVLASQGKTVEEADAAAVSGPTLRADSGYGLYPYNQREVDIYAGLGKPASAPENQPGPGGILSARQTQGAQDGQTQAAVAGASPNNQRVGVRPDSAGGGSGGGASGKSNPGPALKSSGAASKPPENASYAFNGAKAEVEESLRNGRYGGALGHVVRGGLATTVGLGVDTYDKLFKSDYGPVARPAEDFGRAVLGMEDRKEPKAVAPTTTAQVAPKSATPGAGGATTPRQDPGRAAAAATAPKLGDLREVDEGAGTMQQFTKGPGGTVAGWTTVSTPAAKEARSLRDQQWRAEKEKNTANHFADMARQQAHFDGERQRAEGAKPTYINAYRARTERRGQDMSLRGQQLQADVSRENNQNTNSTTLRGQDLDMQGRRLTNESNKLRLQYDMGKDKRDFDEAKSNKAFDQTIQGTEALHKKVLNSLPFVKGDKGPEPDAAGAAAYMNGANAAVARRANELRKTGRVAEAAQLEDQGVANISASDHQNLVDGIEMMKRFSEKNSEWFTSGTSGKMSNNPLDFLVVGPDPKNPKKVLLAGGQTMDMDDVAGMKLANRFGLPQTGNPQTDRFLPK